MRASQARARPARGALLVLALALGGATTADADDEALVAQIRRLAERIEKLERRSRESEREVAPAGHAEPGGGAPLEGIDVGGSLTGVVQQVDGRGAATGERESRASYRGDVTVTLPGGRIGGAEGRIFAHLRFGQGAGVTLRPTYTSTPNTTAFQTAASPDDAYAIVAQAWYQLTVPLSAGGLDPDGSERLELTAGKMDPFLFFDQNAAADDETVRFMNNAFVHNPLLDSGGDTGADAYGFAPGLRIAFVSERNGSDAWGASVGVFGSGPGADFTGSLADPFVMAQLETTHRPAAGQPGTYRIYGWHNGRAGDFGGRFERHAGWGASVDQRIGDALTLFARIGGEFRGRVRFDRALTLGAEIGGDHWGRATDALGLAAGLLRTSGAYRDATADGTLAGYAASGTERIAELYYRWRINDRFDLTPDVQWIRRPGGDASAPDVLVGALRTRVGF